uniref:DUF1232 domain-containing protein n=1 Tax=Fervidobacterium pennivorans TaxID=93466 RepID=A0A7V4FIB1_FERPE
MGRIVGGQFEGEFEKRRKDINVAQDGQKILQQENKVKLLLAVLSGEVVKVALDFFNMVKDYLSAKYKNVPTGTIIAIIVALLYLLGPIDLIPDFTPFIGFSDDVAMIMFVYEKIKQDIEEYRKWKKQQTQDDTPQLNTN